MATVGISIRIDMKKIDEKRIYKGQKGDYLDLTTFVNLDEKDQYGNNGFVSQSVSKEEREAKVKTPILGNVQVFYPANGASSKQDSLESEDVPF